MDRISISNRRSAFAGIVCTVKEYKQFLCPKQSPVYNFKKYNLSIFVSHWLLPVLVKWPRTFGHDWLIVSNFIIYFQFTLQAFSSPPHFSPLPKPSHTSQDFQSLLVHLGRKSHQNYWSRDILSSERRCGIYKWCYLQAPNTIHIHTISVTTSAWLNYCEFASK